MLLTMFCEGISVSALTWIAKFATAGQYHFPKRWGSCWQFDGQEHRTADQGLHQASSLVISQGYKAGIKSQRSEPSAIKAARAQTTPEETFWIVQSLSGGFCVRCRCQTSLQCRGCSHSPSQPHSLWFFRFTSSKGGNVLVALSAASPQLADLSSDIEKCVCAPDGTLGSGSSKTGQRITPGPWQLLLLHKSCVSAPNSSFFLSSIGVCQRHANGSSWSQEEGLSFQ